MACKEVEGAYQHYADDIMDRPVFPTRLGVVPSPELPLPFLLFAGAYSQKAMADAQSVRMARSGPDSSNLRTTWTTPAGQETPYHLQSNPYNQDAYVSQQSPPIQTQAIRGRTTSKKAKKDKKRRRKTSRHYQDMYHHEVAQQSSVYLETRTGTAPADNTVVERFNTPVPASPSSQGFQTTRQLYAEDMSRSLLLGRPDAQAQPPLPGVHLRARTQHLRELGLLPEADDDGDEWEDVYPELPPSLVGDGVQAGQNAMAQGTHAHPRPYPMVEANRPHFAQYPPKQPNYAYSRNYPLAIPTAKASHSNRTYYPPAVPIRSYASQGQLKEQPVYPFGRHPNTLRYMARYRGTMVPDSPDSDLFDPPPMYAQPRNCNRRIATAVPWYNAAQYRVPLLPDNPAVDVNSLVLNWRNGTQAAETGVQHWPRGPG